MITCTLRDNRGNVIKAFVSKEAILNYFAIETLNAENFLEIEDAIVYGSLTRYKTGQVLKTNFNFKKQQ